MAITPRDGSAFVIYCHGAEMQVLHKGEWEAQRRRATPIIKVDREEALVLKRFLRYWLGDDGQGPIYRPRSADVVYDF
jgi:hypothetical protein